VALVHVAGTAAEVAVAIPAPESVHASFRRADARSHEDCRWDQVDAEAVAAGTPWRLFRWHKGQKRYSGTDWSSTERDHVVYKSRLELVRLLHADFDLAVRRIAAQPFLLRAFVGGMERKHVLNFLLLTESGPVVVDVNQAWHNARGRHSRSRGPVTWSSAGLAVRGADRCGTRRDGEPAPVGGQVERHSRVEMLP